MSRPTILFLVTEDWYFWSHRIDLARAAREAGFEVVLAARFTAHQQRIEASGIRCIPLPFVRSLRNPFKEFMLMIQVANVVKSVSPTLVHTVALKSILLSIGAIIRCPKVQFCHAITGLGYLFFSRRHSMQLLRRLTVPLFKWLFARHNCHMIVQNSDDLAMLESNGIGDRRRAVIIRGAGVDMRMFEARPLPVANPPLVILPARMLRDKGVDEFVGAARLLRARGVVARFALVGGLDSSNPAALTEAELNAMCSDGAVEWWGHRDDMPTVFEMATLVCLPSYREGLPKALLEAAACARPLIATDVPGCREICRPGETGILVPPRDAVALAEAIASLLIDRARCVQFGSAARKLVEQAFSAEIINAATVSFYRQVIAAAQTSARAEA